MLYKRCVIVRLSTLQDELLCLYHQNDVTDCVSFTSLHRAVALIRIITKVHLAPPYLMMRDRIRGELLTPIVLISRVHPLPIFYSSSPTSSFFIRFFASTRSCLLQCCCWPCRSNSSTTIPPVGHLHFLWFKIPLSLTAIVVMIIAVTYDYCK